MNYFTGRHACMQSSGFNGWEERCFGFPSFYKSFAHPHPPEKDSATSAMSAPPLPSAAFFAMACFLLACAGAYQRPPPRETLSVPLADDADGLTPQQVHISLVGSDEMRITWVTDDDSPSTVEYSTSSNFQQRGLKLATGSSSSYSYILYRSGQIHDFRSRRCVHPTGNLLLVRTRTRIDGDRGCGAGDLGQTGWTNSTLQHVASRDYDVLLLPGDLSYADYRQSLWDSFGRLVEPMASSRPWMVTQGNHEIEKIPLVHPQPFVAYNARWRMPYDADSVAPSASNLYYSFDVAGGAVHVIMLGSYADFGPGSSQQTWLAFDLARLDRNKTPWVVALIHAPWYNSNAAHQGEGEEMRQAMEALLYGARVDVVFAGHVHAYERFTRVYDNRSDPCGPVHIIIGDGGNREGLASEYLDKPEISVFREASFGHGRLEVANATHALWTWNRNDNDESVEADQVWLTSVAADRACKDMERLNTKLYLRNCYILKENERLRKKAQLLNQENQALLSELRQKQKLAKSSATSNPNPSIPDLDTSPPTPKMAPPSAGQHPC
ncbi:hypothetical protein GW17_00017296 [Ensete ventricosum]|nr:hypothetical protein GW17_00017296 [Ensete ventricosum]